MARREKIPHLGEDEQVFFYQCPSFACEPLRYFLNLCQWQEAAFKQEQREGAFGCNMNFYIAFRGRGSIAVAVCLGCNFDPAGANRDVDL